MRPSKDMTCGKEYEPMGIQRSTSRAQHLQILELGFANGAESRSVGSRHQEALGGAVIDCGSSQLGKAGSRHIGWLRKGFSEEAGRQLL